VFSPIPPDDSFESDHHMHFGNKCRFLSGRLFFASAHALDDVFGGTGAYLASRAKRLLTAFLGPRNGGLMRSEAGPL
jgi:hypothetical protein